MTAQPECARITDYIEQPRIYVPTYAGWSPGEEDWG